MLDSEYTYTDYDNKTEIGIETKPKLNTFQVEMDHPGKPRYLHLTLYGQFKALPCYMDQEGRFFIKSKLTMYNRSISNLVKVRSLGMHLGFYAHSSESIYMHHKECNPKHLTKLRQESNPSKNVSGRPLLRMLKEPESGIIMYQDAGSKFL